MKSNLFIFLILIILLKPSVSHSCTNLIVTKGASKDGSVMLTYSADSHTRYGTLVHMLGGKQKAGAMIPVLEWGKERYLGEIPQVGYTYNVIGNMNEKQLAIGESTWGGIDILSKPDGIMDYGSAIYLTLQRASNAREAIKVFTDLIDTYGYASSGESVSFTDPNEAWYLEIIGKKSPDKGAVWVAIRIPDGYISAHANCARITTINMNDKENVLYSKDVISYARKLGIFNGKDEEFSFADIYNPLDFSAMRGCEARVWSFFRKHGNFDADKYLDYARGDNPNNRMPLYVKAKKPISFKEIADMMRDHYEGTPFDMTKDVGAGGHELPYRWRPMSFVVDGVEVYNERAIATQQTGFWFVAQSRNWLPDALGGLFWFAVDDAGTSPLTPVYASSRAISSHYAYGNGNMIEYSPTSMFWLQNKIAQFAYLRYNQIGAEVREVIDAHENNMVEIVANNEAKLLEKYSSAKDLKKLVKELTKFSVNEADALFNKWNNFDKYLLVKYIDGNTKKQNSDGSFLNNGNCKTIPPSPIMPGYTEKFKSAIKNDLN